MVEEPGERLNYIFDFSFYHSRYHALKSDQIHILTGPKAKMYLGFSPYRNPEPKAIKDPSYVTERKPLGDETLYYLDKIKELAKEHNCTLVFCFTPYVSHYKKKQPVYNSVEDYAKENGIPFLNMNYHLDEMGFDGETDLSKGGHVSYSGAKKVGKCLAEFLKENCDLEDHRGDDAYAVYEESCRQLKEWEQTAEGNDAPEEDESEFE
ncbi:MAG: DUF1574 domain-containing protein [Lachnospiraceae bacterium]|nr:DUF1574 domain-containing protein [Lachnospiraceae bacterium]